MSGFLYDEITEVRPHQGQWSAVIADTLTDFADLASVIIPGLDPSIKWKNCKWQSRNSVDLPQAGNKCLIMFDDNNDIWVVVWWPFS